MADLWWLWETLMIVCFCHLIVRFLNSFPDVGQPQEKAVSNNSGDVIAGAAKSSPGNFKLVVKKHFVVSTLGVFFALLMIISLFLKVLNIIAT
ncbi:MAG: hypothetical protein WC310_02685 [Patescibacteria group bacterium]|jgi:hypothetical protein